MTGVERVLDTRIFEGNAWGLERGYVPIVTRQASAP